ncbi:hypothetical protein EJ419_07265 [Alloscardovia theropitheci]|uniref:Uncharacterized protein n=1 Tax=Alloscardovia theropitheci TaxID=2496842 RepID=A0A4R0QQY8_9BIFI|nr:hypothetical protein [Alloscardovia theropitheci]TCD53758.1 hypothetical protein EJ419_07265 [Alloscardovia theropitheci]
MNIRTLRGLGMFNWLTENVALLGFIWTVVGTIIGAVINHFVNKRSAQKAQEKWDKELAAKNEQIQVLRNQNNELQRQTDVLEKQLALELEHSEAPQWNLYRDSSIRFILENRNTYTSCGVTVHYITSQDGEVAEELGNLTSGSEKVFECMMAGIWGGLDSDEFRITWHRENSDELREITLAIPPQ